MSKTARLPLNLSEGVKLAAADRLMRQDLGSFLRVAFETIVPGEELHLNWHLKAIAHALEKVMRGDPLYRDMGKLTAHDRDTARLFIKALADRESKKKE
jgi:hypothetical protein